MIGLMFLLAMYVPYLTQCLGDKMAEFERYRQVDVRFGRHHFVLWKDSSWDRYAVAEISYYHFQYYKYPKVHKSYIDEMMYNITQKLDEESRIKKVKKA